MKVSSCDSTTILLLNYKGHIQILTELFFGA